MARSRTAIGLTFGVAGLAAAIVLSAVAYGQDRDGPPQTAVRAPFVGTAACAECHRKEFDAWSSSSHARSFERATDANMPAEVVQGATVAHAPSSTTFRRDGAGYVAETVGPDGMPTDYDLTHVVGRMRIRMFVATLPDGRMQVLPAMLEAPTNRWFDYTHLLFGNANGDWDTPPAVAPGEASFWTGAVRSWDARCSRCHTSGWQSVERDSTEHGRRSSWRALAIDCEECHGPGLAHTIAWRDLDPDAQDAALPRLEKLPRAAATAVCARCHMEGEVVSATFEPDRDLYEHLDPTLLLDPERVDPAGRPLELIYDGLPFAVSRCANEGGLTCRDCHEPHGGAVRSQLRAEPSSGDLCVRCHRDVAADVPAHTHHLAEGSGATCVACHMPFLAIERGHGAVADHSISVPRPEARGDRVAQDACTWCHSGGINAPPGASPLSPERVRDAYATWWPNPLAAEPWMDAIASGRLGEPGAPQALVSVLRDDAVPREVRASAVRLLARFPEEGGDAILAAVDDPDLLVRRNAVTALASLPAGRADAVLLRALNDDAPTVRFAAARASLSGWTRVRENRALLAAILPVLESEAVVLPDDNLRWFRLGAARSLAGDRRGALAAYERMLALDPFAHSVRRQVERLREQIRRE